MLTARFLIALLAMSMMPVDAANDAANYKLEIEKWREQREQSLKSEDGWLTLAGLFWLKEGNSSVGADRENDIVLPAGSAPGKVGTFAFHEGKAEFASAPGVQVKVNGKPVSTAVLASDTADSPDVLQIGSLTMLVIQRGQRTGIRVKDANSEVRRSFHGTRWFPVAREYRVTARFVAYPPGRKIAVPNILGDVNQEDSPGYVEFTLKGQPLRLDAVVDDNDLFLIFKDQTTGKETYPAGRFLHADMPKNDETVLEFNNAYCPPCAFTPYATCPLPPRQNELAIRIEAGELRYGH